MSDELKIRRGKVIKMGEAQLYISGENGEMIPVGEVKDVKIKTMTDDEKFLIDCGVDIEESKE